MRFNTRTPLDQDIIMKATQHVANLTKPLGSLGALEEIYVRLAGITGQLHPDIGQKAVVIMCGDHGVAAEGVSAYPQAVTGLMIHNFVKGKAAVNVLARQHGAEVRVVDVGSLLDEVPPPVLNRQVRKGTANFTEGPAMSVNEAKQATEAGMAVVRELKEQGVRLLAVGEMGIGNTTPGTAVAAALTGLDVDSLTGRGTGVSNEGFHKKQQAIRQALAIHRPDPSRPLELLARIGGLEIAGMAGCYLGAAKEGLPVVMDGLISTAAALLAVKMEPAVREVLFASHLSVEPAHAALLRELGLEPLITAGMRLGEASGAVLSFPLFDSAVGLAREMATFADLGLPNPASIT
ncbi:nicotinate-nucleotide--dimethylbenzimidazole phosphoribosyltransferase [Laceyella putida]|uniref:Nicotinate-nucleotide--dimethylbenzimidazole phosphoribosyltransferase n=1 Tax=Laceyella putida TaxID=110101 RepID=A0ABW2RKB2_9BACL